MTLAFTSSGFPPSMAWSTLNTPTTSAIDTRVANRRNTPTLPTAITLMSECSKPPRCSLFAAMMQSLLEIRIVDRHQWTLTELGEEIRQPDSDQAQGRADIGNAEMEILVEA